MVFLINDIILQYLHTYPDADVKIDAWNSISHYEEALRSHLQLYDQYQEEFMRNQIVFAYTLFHDSTLISCLRFVITYRLLVLKKFPIYKHLVQKYQDLSRKVRAVNKFRQSIKKNAIERVDLETQEQ